MAKHPFAKKAINSLQDCYERTCFALNIPMSDSDRTKLKSLLKQSAEIINKY